MKGVALLALIVCVLTLPPLMNLAAARPGEGPFIVLHPPWVDGGAAVTAAGGRLVGLSDTTLTTLADAPDPQAFLARMQDAGHGLVLEAGQLPFLCADRANPVPGSGVGAFSSSPATSDTRP
ncbi:MAG: hypothetical protein ACOCYW_02645 [Roseicyclus sp.]